jgi:predicted transcriptional regulator
MQYHRCMQRITTNVEPGVYARLTDLARHRAVPTSHLIREALESYVSEQEAHLEPEPLPDWVGMLEGPGGPFATRDEETLRESWAQSIDPREV